MSYHYLFDPVPSRRLGRSLGVDLVPHKTCSFNCIYCERGKTTLKFMLIFKINFRTLKRTLNAEWWNENDQCDKSKIKFISARWRSFQYVRGIQSDKVFINKGFVHLRHVHKLNRKVFKWELFVQKEFNDFILLLDRNLIGGGIRTTIVWNETGVKKSKNYRFIRLYLGNGLMGEKETLDTSPVFETKIIRSTNYLSLRWQTAERVAMDIVSYFQFHLSNVNDYRVLFQGSFGFNITKSLVFRASLNLRYDSEPPLDVKKHDLELTNGIGFSF